MNKKSFTALLVAIFLPLTGYLLVSYYSKDAVQMPQRYFYDSVNVINNNGKLTYDTSWHHVSNLHFTNQLGQKVSFDDLKGKIIVLDFFFTHCPTICPQLAKSMKKLQNSFPNNDSIVQFVSISIDPKHDSVAQLRKWAAKFNVNPDSWWLLTGDRDSIYNFALHEMKASVADSNVDTAFIHTQNFFLLDKNARIFIWVVSIVVFIGIAFLSGVQLHPKFNFDPHIFATLNAIINSCVAIFLIAALLAVKSKRYLLHERIMIAAIILSVLFLISYVCHHLFSGETKFGDLNHDGILSWDEKNKAGSLRYVYYAILMTHIPLAGIILPFILFTAYRALSGDYVKHKKLARITWPIWLYVAISGVAVYLLISPYYS